MDNLLGTHAVMRDGAEVGTLAVTQSANMTVFELSSGYSGGDVFRLCGVSAGSYVNIGVAAPEGGMLRLTKKFSKSALASMRLEPETGFFLVLSGERHEALSPPEVEPEPIPEPEPAPEPVPEPEPAPEPEPEPMPEPLPEPEPTPEPEPEPEPVPEPMQAAVPPEPPKAAGVWTPIADPSVLFSDPDTADACRNANGALTMERNGVRFLAIPVSSGEPFPMMPVLCFGDSAQIGGREYIVFKSKNGKFLV